MGVRNALVLSVCVGALTAGTAKATTVTTSDPSLSSEIGARIRWGGTGFEGSVYDSNSLNQSPTLNPGGNPVWGLNAPYKFEVTFDSITGTLGLSVDFNRDDSFGAGESITRSAFSAPGLTSYQGYGFNYLYISGNEGGSTARSAVNNLKINGTSLSSLAPGGTFLQQFYKDSSGQPMTSIDITGDLTFTTAGTSQERPSWNFVFQGPATPSAVPLPSAAWGGLALIGGLGLVTGVKRTRRRVA